MQFLQGFLCGILLTIAGLLWVLSKWEGPR